jgi:hypothetical protein
MNVAAPPATLPAMPQRCYASGMSLFRRDSPVLLGLPVKIHTPRLCPGWPRCPDNKTDRQVRRSPSSSNLRNTLNDARFIYTTSYHPLGHSATKARALSHAESKRFARTKPLTLTLEQQFESAQAVTVRCE